MVTYNLVAWKRCVVNCLCQCTSFFILLKAYSLSPVAQRDAISILTYTLYIYIITGHLEQINILLEKHVRQTCFSYQLFFSARMKHFETIGSHLRTIRDFPTIHDQICRYQNEVNSIYYFLLVKFKLQFNFVYFVCWLFCLYLNSICVLWIKFNLFLVSTPFHQYV